MDNLKHDDNKIRLDLITPEMIYALGEVLTAGSIKYGDRSWERGMAWSRVFGATLRHLWLWFAGINLDNETRLSHLKHALCNVGFLITYEARNAGKDDRVETRLVQINERDFRVRIVQRFDDILDPFIFEIGSSDGGGAICVPAVRHRIRVGKSRIMGARRPVKKQNIQSYSHSDDTGFANCDLSQYHG